MNRCMILILALVLGTLAAGNNVEAAPPLSPQVEGAPLLAAGPSPLREIEGVWLCHLDGHGSVRLIFVPTPTIEREGAVTQILLYALVSHLSHGDYGPIMTSTGPSCE